MKRAKKTLAVMFGGRSAEHEISIITALQAILAIDTLKYQVIPLYIHPSGKWYTGKELLDKSFYKGMPHTLSKAQRVGFLSDPTIGGVVPISPDGTMQVEQAIPIDVYFLAFHGQHGEDGCIQGMLEMANAAYTGCDVIASAVAMNKYHCKIYLEGHGIPVLPSVAIKRTEAMEDLSHMQSRILQTPGLDKYPLFIKPCRLGSSIGISRAYNLPELNAGLAKVFKYDDSALVEPCVKELLEINVAVLDGDPPIASVVEIPVATSHSLTYEDKYMRNGSKASDGSCGMASLSRVIDPKDLDPAIKRQVQEYSVKAFQALGCSGVGRFDFIYDLECKKIYFNELNPIPGSLAFYLWEKGNPPLLYTDVIERMIEQAINRKAERMTLQRDIGFKALLANDTTRGPK